MGIIFFFKFLRWYHDHETIIGIIIAIIAVIIALFIISIISSPIGTTLP